VDAVKAFKTADKNSNGLMDARELFDGLRQLFPGITRPECNRVYCTLNNRTGNLKMEEFLQAVATLKTFAEISRSAPTGGYDWEIPYSELTLNERLGEGSTGRVFKGEWKGLPVAIKVIKQNLSNEMMEEFKKEVRAFCKLRHPNVVSNEVRTQGYYIGDSVAILRLAAR
jgi:serine/threonine protein kinase